MHIEPGLVDGTKLLLSYATATAALAYTAKLAWGMVKHSGAAALLLRSVIASVLVFVFFEVFPPHPVGISEVHLILGTTLLLIFGAAPGMASSATVGISMAARWRGSLPFRSASRGSSPPSTIRRG